MSRLESDVKKNVVLPSQGTFLNKKFFRKIAKKKVQLNVGKAKSI